MQLKQIIEKIVDAKKPNGDEANFNMGQLVKSAWPVIESDPIITPIVPRLKASLGKDYDKLAETILRNVFLIELVKKPKIETTKFRVRWIDELGDDPRGCSFGECFHIAQDLIRELPGWLGKTPEHDLSLRLSFNCSLIPYEAPLDYQLRKGTGAKLHTRGNLAWLFDPLVLRTLKLRAFLRDGKTSPDAEFFRTALNDKIKVKTYLTDRVLTGEHKTNREKRWETHPESVHFADRRTCLAIEYALVTQICRFDGFPRAAITQLQGEKVLPSKLDTALCPITGDKLSYEFFRKELLSPQHGKSDFQIGHLNPLKLGDANRAAGHTADNISWISADGNRIQGSLSLSDVRKLITRIASNYSKHRWWPEDKSNV